MATCSAAAGLAGADFGLGNFSVPAGVAGFFNFGLKLALLVKFFGTGRAEAADSFDPVSWGCEISWFPSVPRGLGTSCKSSVQF